MNTVKTGRVIGNTLAFCAAAVVVCGLALGAKADIIYSGAGFTASEGGSGNVEISIDGFSYNLLFANGPFIFNSVYPDFNTALAGDGFGDASNLPSGTTIDGNTFLSSGAPDISGSLGAEETISPFFVQSGYLATAYFLGGDPTNPMDYDYGWIGYTLDGGVFNDYPITVTGEAYNNVPGQGIAAGQEGGPAVPEPNSIMLMMSAVVAGLPLYRRLRKTPSAT